MAFRITRPGAFLVMRSLILALYHTRLEPCLPEKTRERLRRWWRTSRLRRWFHKRRAHELRARKAATVSVHGLFDEEEFVQVLHERGIQGGGVLFVHCSFNDLYTFSGSPMGVLSVLSTVVGAEGTLLMPAYTKIGQSKSPRLFNPAVEPTYTGVVNEIFRRSPGVTRSLHPRHSICGRGPLAAELLADHDKCVRADGPDSPFDRMRMRDDTQILTLGVVPGFVSFLHWVEDIDTTKLPFNVHLPHPIGCPVLCPDGLVRSVDDWQLKPGLRADFAQHSKNLSARAMSFTEYKGIGLGVYPMRVLADELLALRDQGVIHY